jgi:MmeI, target recognition domain
LIANSDLCSPGVKLHGSGFIVTAEQAARLGLGSVADIEKHVRHYRHGKDLAGTPRGVLVIDMDGLSAEDVLRKFPAAYQWLVERVKPERDHNNEEYRRTHWWLFGRKNTLLRAALKGLPRYVSTPETTKHRFFVFLDSSILPDNMLVNIGLADAFFLGALSSRVHVTWALAAGGRLGVGNDPRYNKTRCFDPFPFPACTEEQKQRIRDLGEQLDRHRKERQALHPDLTITGMYNVLEKLKLGEALTDKERAIHEKGLVSVLKQIHEDLDREVFAAYGWPATGALGLELRERLQNTDR